MSWMTKDLTLKLIHVAIVALVNAYDHIEKADAEPTTPKPAEEPKQPKKQPQPTEEPTVTLPDIQTALRTIAQTEGTDWIQKELFPALQITNITTLEQQHYPLAWELITNHKEQRD